MLKDEARLLASLNHPNIVRYYNIDVIENKFALVMEYIKGSTLRDLIIKGAVEIAQVVDIIAQVLDGVGYAHTAGVLHRDLKPENILIATENNKPVVKITDFGLARFIKPGSLSASVAGTPIYMAPESWSGQFTNKSDIWSIGIILYELIADVPPFLDESLDGLRKKIEKNMPLVPRIIRPEIPNYLEEAIIKCLNSNPSLRPDAEELLRQITKKGRAIKVRHGFSIPERAHQSIKLTPVQEDIIHWADSRILLLGQAGCGKTTTLLYTIAYLLQRGIPEEKILICTFTNKAANDLRERLQRLVSFSTYNLWLGTIHTVGIRILRHYAERLDFSEDFAIGEPKKLFKELIAKLQIKSTYRANAIIKAIENLKARNIKPEDFTPSNSWEEVIKKLYLEYQNFLKEKNCLDFNDLILYAVKLLEEYKDIRDYYQRLFDYIFVDELQDINPAQYQLISLLCRNNIFFTGDEDQAIYGWRGGERELIYRAAKDFRDMRVFTLNQSFRLPQAILEIANNLMHRRATAIPTPHQGDVVVYTAQSEDDEVNYIIQEIRNLKKKGGRFGDIAILYRMNALVKSYEEGLLKSHTPHTIVAGRSFYEIPEIRSLIEYLEIIEIFQRDKNKKEFFARIQGLFKLKKNRLSKFNEILNYHLENINSLSPFHIIDEITRFLKLNNQLGIDELLLLSKGYSAQSLPEFLNELALMQELELVDWSSDTVKLMTIHSAKGIEFPVVFLVDLTEDFFPLTSSMFSQKELEEERRLCYVGITRAQNKLYLVYPKWRYGRHQKPSRFLVDMLGSGLHRGTDSSAMLTT